MTSFRKSRVACVLETTPPTIEHCSAVIACLEGLPRCDSRCRRGFTPPICGFNMRKVRQIVRFRSSFAEFEIIRHHSSAIQPRLHRESHLGRPSKHAITALQCSIVGGVVSHTHATRDFRKLVNWRPYRYASAHYSIFLKRVGPSCGGRASDTDERSMQGRGPIAMLEVAPCAEVLARV